MNQIKSIEEKASYLYEANRAYREGNPIISDDVYDYLEREVRELDPDNEVLSKIRDHDFGVTKKLTIAMGSQDKARNLEEMGRFYNRIDSNDLICASEKLDGMSFELTYKHGNFVSAISRGDGEYGVDYTSIMIGAKDIPPKISYGGTLIVRGEALILKSDLPLLNKELEAEGRDTYINTRNGVSGIVKTLKNVKYSKYITFRAFNVIKID